MKKLIYVFVLVLMSCFYTQTKGQDTPSDTTYFSNDYNDMQLMNTTTPAWLQGSNLLYTNPAVNVGIGTSSIDSKLDINYGVVGTSSGHSGKAMRILGASHNTSLLYADLALGLNNSSCWSSQAQVWGVSSSIKLKRSTSTTYSNVNAGGFFSVKLDAYTHRGSNLSKICGVYGRVQGAISSYPGKHVIAGIYGLDEINSGLTWAGYFQGRGYFSENVGIGTLNPVAKLDVAGNIKAHEIEVTLASIDDMRLNGTLAANNITYTANGQTADHVFEEDYNLRSLNEIETFIKTNKHLPDVPSAKEMEEQGVNLAEMNKLLLQKLEELTLYVIQQQKEIEQLKGLMKK